MNRIEAILGDKEKVQRVLDWAILGYEPDELQYKLDHEFDTRVSQETIQAWLDSEETQEKMSTRARVMEKDAEIEKEELLRDLRSVKDMLLQKVDELKDSEHGVTFNESIKNLTGIVHEIGDFIGELESAKGATNIITIDQVHVFVENNYTQIFNSMDDEKKEEIVHDLSNELGLVVTEEA